MSKKKIIIKAFLTAFCCFFLAALSNAETCSTAGQVQYKYTASGCSYTTQTRTCCATTGAWSDWGGSCPSCSSSQCWNGSTCEDKGETTKTCGANTTGTTLTRTATCVNGSGWKYGSWQGSCVCTSNLYYLSGTSCNKCWVTQTPSGASVQTYYITSAGGATCCQPQCCRTSGGCNAQFSGRDPCCSNISEL